MMCRLFCSACKLSRSVEHIAELINEEEIEKTTEKVTVLINSYRESMESSFKDYIINGGELIEVLQQFELDKQIFYELDVKCKDCSGVVHFEIYPYFEAYRTAKQLYKQIFRINLERTGLDDLYNASKPYIGQYTENAILGALLKNDSKEIEQLRRSLELHNALPPESGAGEEELIKEIIMAIGFGIIGNLATDFLKWGFRKTFGRMNVVKRKRSINTAIQEEIERYNKHEPKYHFSSKEKRRIRKAVKNNLKLIIDETTRKEKDRKKKPKN
jgi:hypothetical protein